MTYGVDAYVWGNETVVANGYLSLVEHYEIEVREEIVAYLYVASVIAVEGLIDKKVFAYFA